MVACSNDLYANQESVQSQHTHKTAEKKVKRKEKMPGKKMKGNTTWSEIAANMCNESENPSWCIARALARRNIRKLWSNRIVLHIDCSYCRERSVDFIYICGLLAFALHRWRWWWWWSAANVIFIFIFVSFSFSHLFACLLHQVQHGIEVCTSFLSESFVHRFSIRIVTRTFFRILFSVISSNRLLLLLISFWSFC